MDEEDEKKSKRRIFKFGRKMGFGAIIIIMIVALIAASAFQLGLLKEESINSKGTGKSQSSSSSSSSSTSDSSQDGSSSGDNPSDSDSSDSSSPNYYREYGPDAYMDSIYVQDDGSLMAEMSIDEMWEKDDRYKRYLSGKNALAYLLNAQIVTQYPYLDSAPEGSFNGTIRFYRNNKNKPMVYKSKEELQELVDKYNNEKDSKVMEEALNCFSVNNNGSITIAYYTTEVITFEASRPEIAEKLGIQRTQSDTGTTLSTTTISYLSYVQNYVLPFNLLWAIVVNGSGVGGKGDAEDLAHAIATMAYEGSIDLIIDDNRTVTTDKDVYSYTEMEYFAGPVYANGSKETQTEVGQAEKDFDSKSYTCTHDTDYNEVENGTVTYIEIHTVNTPSIKTKKITSWIATQKNTTPYKDGELTNSSNNSSTLDDTELEEAEQITVGDGNINNLCSRAPGLQNWKSGLDSSYNHSFWGRLTRSTNLVNITKESASTTKQTGYLNYNAQSPNLNKDIISMFKVGVFRDVKKFITKDVYKSFIETISTNEDTADMVDLINYIFNQIYGNNQYYTGEGDFQSIWNDLYGGNMSAIVTAADDFVVHTEKSDASLVIKDNKVFEKALSATYSGQRLSNLMSVVNDGTLLKLQEEYKVNAVFAIAVATIESGCGTAWAAIPQSSYNWMSMLGSYNGRTTGRWRIYDSFSQATLDFGDQIANNEYYFSQGKYSVKQIAPTYCNDGWGEKVVAQMKEIYEAAGITFNTGTSSTAALGDGYTTTITLNGRTYKEFKQDASSSYYNDRYSNGNIATSGCGPTSVAIVASGYGSPYNPGTLISAAKSKYNVSNFIASSDATGKMLTTAGLNYNSTHSLTESQLRSHLSSGRPVVACIGGNSSSPFSTADHYIAVLGINGDQVYVSNPINSRTSGWFSISTFLNGNSGGYVAFLITN